MSTNDESPVYLNPSDDPDMQEAMSRARRTFRYFWRELSWEYRRIVPGLDLASVKIAFSDPPEPDAPPEDSPTVEQMWVSDVEFDGKRIRGTLLNEPNWLTSVEQGDDIDVPTKLLSDWMYAIAGKVYGAYTVNLLRSRMDRGERRQHDEAWGLEFGDPDDIEVVPPEWLGRKPAKKGLLGGLFGGKPKPVSPKKIAATEHPMSVNMAESLEEALQQDPSNATQPDERGFTMLHQLALAGSANGVEILLRHGADPSATTHNGMTPLALAKSLGWKRVVELLSSGAA